MPLECVHCRKRFPVNFENVKEAFEFGVLLKEHTTSHGDLAPEYQLIDENGVPASESSLEEVKKEEKLLSKVSKYLN